MDVSDWEQKIRQLWKSGEAAQLLALIEDKSGILEDRIHATRVLGAIGKETLPFWQALAKNDQLEGFFQNAVAYRLRQFGLVKDAIEIWQRLALDSQQNSRQRKAALKYLDEIGTEDSHQSIKEIIENLKTDKGQERYLRAIANDYYLSQTTRLAAEKAAFQQRVGPLLDAIHDESQDERHRKGAVIKLAELNQIGELSDLVYNNKLDINIRLTALLRLSGRFPIRSEQAMWANIGSDEKIDPLVRLRAARKLVKLKTPKIAAQIFETLGLDIAIDKKTRMEIASELLKIGQEHAATKIYLAIAQSTVVGTKQWSTLLRRLAKLGQVEEVKNILRNAGLTRNYSKRQRAQVAEELNQLCSDEESAQIFFSFIQDKSYDLRERAHFARRILKLGVIDYSVKAWLFLANEAKDKDIALLNEAGEILNQLGATDTWGDILQFAAQQASANGQLGLLAAKTLDNTKTGRIWFELAVNKYVSYNTRLDAIHQLSKVGKSDLPRIANDVTIEPALRLESMQELVQLGQDNEVIPLLNSYFRNEEEDFSARKRAGEILIELGHQSDVLPVLLQIVHDKTKEDWVRQETAEMLGQLGETAEAIQTLLAIGSDLSTDHWVRKRVAEALIGLEQVDNAIPMLLLAARGIKTKRRISESTPIEVLTNLGKMNELFLLARDESISAWTRLEAIEALTQLGQEDRLTPLLRNLMTNESTPFGIRKQVAESLALDGDQSAIEILKGLTR